jgi:ankyrin repeat protein
MTNFAFSLLETASENRSESLVPYFIEATFIYAALVWFVCWGFGISLKDRASKKAGLAVLVLCLLPSWFVFGFFWSMFRSIDMIPLPKYSSASNSATKQDNKNEKNTLTSGTTPDHYFVKPQKPGDNEFGISIKGQLLNAALVCDTAELTKLLDKGVDVNMGANDGGVTPLGFAVREACTMDGCIDAVKVLLAHRADVNARNMGDGVTALMWACMGKCESATEIAKMLMAKAADVNARDKRGWTVIKWAKKYKNQTTIGILKEAGAK